MREIKGGPGTPYRQSFVYAHVIYEIVIAYVLAQGSMGIVEIDNDAAVTMLFELKDIFDLCLGFRKAAGIAAKGRVTAVVASEEGPSAGNAGMAMFGPTDGKEGDAERYRLLRTTTKDNFAENVAKMMTDLIKEAAEQAGGSEEVDEPMEVNTSEHFDDLMENDRRKPIPQLFRHFTPKGALDQLLVWLIMSVWAGREAHEYGAHPTRTDWQRLPRPILDAIPDAKRWGGMSYEQGWVDFAAWLNRDVGGHESDAYMELIPGEALGMRQCIDEGIDLVNANNPAMTRRIPRVGTTVCVHAMGGCKTDHTINHLSGIHCFPTYRESMKGAAYMMPLGMLDSQDCRTSALVAKGGKAPGWAQGDLAWWPIRREAIVRLPKTHEVVMLSRAGIDANEPMIEKAENISFGIGNTCFNLLEMQPAGAPIGKKKIWEIMEAWRDEGGKRSRSLPALTIDSPPQTSIMDMTEQLAKTRKEVAGALEGLDSNPEMKTPMDHGSSEIEVMVMRALMDLTQTANLVEQAAPGQFRLGTPGGSVIEGVDAIQEWCELLWANYTSKMIEDAKKIVDLVPNILEGRPPHLDLPTCATHEDVMFTGAGLGDRYPVTLKYLDGNRKRIDFCSNSRTERHLYGATMAQADGEVDGKLEMALGKGQTAETIAKISQTWPAFTETVVQAAEQAAPGVENALSGTRVMSLYGTLERLHKMLPVHMSPPDRQLVIQV